MFRISVDSVAEAITESAKQLIRSGSWTDNITDETSIGSGFGQKPRRTLEVIGASIEIRNPNKRQCVLETRPMSIGFSLANALWTVRASRDARDIVPYNPRGNELLNSEGIFDGAMGARIAMAYSDRNALESIRNLIAENPMTRRAVAPLILRQDIESRPRDFPCVVACQYFQRAGKLHAITYMRSQSLTGLLGYDLFLFTFLQQMLAIELGLDVGVYTHSIGSLHIYENEEEKLQSIAKDVSAAREFPLGIRTSPLGDDRILIAEERIRKGVLAGDASPIVTDVEVDESWRPLLAILEIRLRVIAGEIVQIDSPLYNLVHDRGYTEIDI